MTRKSELTKKIIARSIVALTAVFLYFPILVLIIFSFTTGSTIGQWNGFSFSLYADLFRNPTAMSAVGTTFLVAIVSSLIAVILGTFTAIGMFHIRRSITRSALMAGTQITVINAEVVTGIAFSILFTRIGLSMFGGSIMGYGTLITAHVMFTTPFVILAVMPRLYRLNPNLYEAGQDLGAKPLRTMFTVIMPQLIPGMLSGFALAFTISLDDFVVGNFTRGHLNTISSWLYNTRQGTPAESRALSTIIFTIAFIALAVLYIKNKRAQKAYKQQNSK